MASSFRMLLHTLVVVAEVVEVVEVDWVDDRLLRGGCTTDGIASILPPPMSMLQPLSLRVAERRQGASVVVEVVSWLQGSLLLGEEYAEVAAVGVPNEQLAPILMSLLFTTTLFLL